MKRRSPKPFTIEIKKRGRRRDGDATPAPDEGTAYAAEPIFGRDIRFRDAETLFRDGFADDPVTEPAPTLFSAAAEPAFQKPDLKLETSRRILPDLVAEAALNEAATAAVPQPARRRGRPPKQISDSPPLATKRRGRPPGVRRIVEAPPSSVSDGVTPFVVPAVLYLAASARRRAARDTGNLPRGERWKRRLPKVCW